MRILVLIAVLSACGNDSTTSNEPREVTTKEETKYETRTECEWQTQCRNVRVRRRGKWDHPHYRRSCERVQVCEDIIVPVSI